MSTVLLSRRALLGLALAAPLAGASRVSAQVFGSAPAAATTFSAVSVDVSPLLDHGGGSSARLFGDALLAEMRTTFADRIGARNAPLLTARITNLFLVDYSGTDGDFAFGHNDNIEGDGVVSSGGRVLSTTHILTELPPSYSGAYYTQGIDRIRLSSLAHQFAYWLRREMNT